MNKLYSNTMIGKRIYLYSQRIVPSTKTEFLSSPIANSFRRSLSSSQPEGSDNRNMQDKISNPAKDQSTQSSGVEKEKEIKAKENKNTFLYNAAAMLNDSFDKYPRDSIACLIGLEILSIYGTHTLIVASGLVQVPAEFAVAFALNRAVRKFRWPIEFLFTGILSEKVPALTEVKITSLTKAIPEKIREKFVDHEESKAARDKVQNLFDQYGISYLIAARWTGVLSVFSIYSLLRLGVDVSPIFSYLGITEYGSVLGTWAASVSISSLIYPFTFLLSGYLSPILYETRKKIIR